MEAIGVNGTLESEVSALRRQVARLERLKQFVAPEISRLVLSEDGATLLGSHEREVVVMFFDLRGFTSFVQRTAPPQVIDTLRAWHRLIGGLARDWQATVERFTGDGVMVFFNDPVVVPDPCVRAVRKALAMRGGFRELSETWARRGATLGLGTGIAQGKATVGAIGTEDRSDYAAIGTVTNLAARFCATADAGQILVCPAVASATRAVAKSRPVGELVLHGFPAGVPAFEVMDGC
jgi:class 3 adenylate cyclase